MLGVNNWFSSSMVPRMKGFPCGSAGKESTCSEGELGLIPGLERSPGERKATHSSILAWRIPWTVYPWGHKESDTTEQISLSLHFFIEWSGGFPYFLQCKSEFGDKEPQ